MNSLQPQTYKVQLGQALWSWAKELQYCTDKLLP